MASKLRTFEFLHGLFLCYCISWLCMYACSQLPFLKSIHPQLKKKIVLMKLLGYLEFYGKAVSEYSNKYAWFACCSSTWVVRMNWKRWSRILGYMKDFSQILRTESWEWMTNLMKILPVDSMVNKCSDFLRELPWLQYYPSLL